MSEFFRGWKHKVGVMQPVFNGWRRLSGSVLLLLACAGVIGWIRSLIFFDTMTIATGTHEYIQVQSEGCCIEYRLCYCIEYRLCYEVSKSMMLVMIWDDHWFETGTPRDPREVEPVSVRTNVWCKEIPGFCTGEGVHDNSISEMPKLHLRCRIHRIAYWAIVTPLLTLSGYLLFSPLRHKPT